MVGVPYRNNSDCCLPRLLDRQLHTPTPNNLSEAAFTIDKGGGLGFLYDSALVCGLGPAVLEVGEVSGESSYAVGFDASKVGQNKDVCCGPGVLLGYSHLHPDTVAKVLQFGFLNDHSVLERNLVHHWLTRFLLLQSILDLVRGHFLTIGIGS